jgi:hypothetical protein
MNITSWNRGWDEDSLQRARIEVVRALLSIINAAQAEEDIAEDQVSRQMCLTMQRMAMQLVVEITRLTMPRMTMQLAGRLIWV